MVVGEVRSDGTRYCGVLILVWLLLLLVSFRTGCTISIGESKVSLGVAIFLCRITAETDEIHAGLTHATSILTLILTAPLPVR